MQKYLKVMGFQLKLDLDSNYYQEYLIKTKEYINQLQKSLEMIKKQEPDLIIYPEMSYDDNFEKEFSKLSKNRLIIAGSTYRNKINTTIVFQNGVKKEIPKQFASGAEPMTRFIDKKQIEDFLGNDLKDHTFMINDRKIIVLNCMEYYHAAYYVARKVPDLFAIVSPCSNNNPKVFKEESKALHNHNENIYSFVVNGVSPDNSSRKDKGESYIYGPIQYHEKEWLQKEGLDSDPHPCSILNMDHSPSCFYGEFTNNLVPYGRSDDYINNPKNIFVKKLEKEKS